MIVSISTIFNDLERPARNPGFKVTLIFDADYRLITNDTI